VTRVRLGLCLGSLALSAWLFGCKKSTAEPARPNPVSWEQPKGSKVLAWVYNGALQPGWQDWGWGSHDLSRGPARIDMSSFGGWILHADAFPPGASGVAFEMFAPSSFGSFLQVHLGNAQNDKSFPLVDVTADAMRPKEGGWYQIYVPWEALNPGGLAADRLIFNAKKQVPNNPVQFDNVRLIGLDAAARAAAAKSVKVGIDCRAPARPISQYIYGIATVDVQGPGATAARWGGNPTSRYNWQLGKAWNLTKDWYFQNAQGGDYRVFLTEARQRNTFAAITVPTIGWVAKDTSSFGFPVSKYGAQRATDPQKPDAGDGTKPDGSLIRPTSPTQTSVPADPAFIRQWVETIRATEEKQGGARSARMYILDNEPNLWNTTHRDVHPDGLTYDELLDRTIRYGTAVREADPKALIAGPAEWGWTGYLYSAKDMESSAALRPDRRAHGDQPLIAWYLKKLREHEQAKGVRILDVLDVHFYPQGNGIYGPNSDPATAAARIRSTRALWDPNYVDESWINEKIRLIPRLKEWVQQNYPGLAISLGEYNFGGENHMSGALAQAEALGRFAQGGVSYAFYWLQPPKDSPVYWAFRAYRNFDGAGGRFLDQYVETQMTDNVSLFASRDASGKHLVAIALNLDPANPAKVQLGLKGCAELESRRKFSFVEGSKGFRDDGSQPNITEELLPPYSITVFDLRLK